MVRAAGVALIVGVAIAAAGCGGARGPAPNGRAATASAPASRRRSTATATSGETAPTATATTSGAAATPTSSPSAGIAAGREGVPAFSHIFLIVMENQGPAVMRQPYLASLARRFALATNYYGVTHPSLPNYLALVGGATFGIRSDCTACHVKGRNLVDQLQAAGRSWDAYLQGLPRPGFLGAENLLGLYAGKHNPFRYFDDIAGSPSRLRHLLPYKTLVAALAAGRPLPDFVWITPNLCNDMHSCPPAQGDSWLAANVPPLLASPAWRQGGVLFIVWDEGTGAAGPGPGQGGARVALLIISPLVGAGARTAAPLDHYSLLRTIEDAWSLPYLGHAAGARPVAGVWSR